MIIIRKGNERGMTQTAWLDSLHTFSFSEYYDPDFMGFRTLRVINQDTVQPGMGFALHSHKNMEIISYVIEGALSHKDSIGNGSTIRAGEIQCMSAGTGIKHSEFNNSTHDVLHFLQIWITPQQDDLTPQYQQQPIPQIQNELILIGSPEKKINLIHINQDVMLYTAYLLPDQTIQYIFAHQRAGWLQLVKGELTINGHLLIEGDGAEITEDHIEIKSMSDAEFLLFDLN